MFCGYGKPLAVLSVQVPLYAGLLDGLHSFPRALVRSWSSRLEAVYSDEKATD